MTMIDDPSLYESEADNKMRLKVMSKDIFSLLKPFLVGLTPDKIHEEIYFSFTEYQIWDSDVLVKTLRLFRDGKDLRIEEVTATSIINTEAGDNLVQENGGRLLTE